MNYFLPRIRIVNNEIKDPHLYLGDFKIKDFKANFSVKLHDVFEMGYVFFIHIALRYPKDDGNSEDILHLDYVSVINTEEKFDFDKEILIPVDSMAHSLGTSILMVRGSISTLLQYHPLEQFQLQLMNPMALLEGILEKKQEHFILSKDTTTD